MLAKIRLYPAILGQSPAEVLVTVFEQELARRLPGNCLRSAQAGLKVALYPEAAKLARQFKYGDRMGIRLAVVQGRMSAGRADWRKKPGHWRADQPAHQPRPPQPSGNACAEAAS